MNNIDKINLSETRNNLFNEIALLSFDQFNKKYESNKWSVAQVCHHLVLTERAFTKAIVLGLKKEDRHTEQKNIHFMLDRKKKILAPEIVEPGLEELEVQQVIDSLKDSRNQFLALLATVQDWSILAKKSFKHPVFGELPLDQWIKALYLHEQRHIDQIKEIKLLNGVRK